MNKKQMQISDKLAAAGANENIHASLQFASVQDSRENLFISGLNNGLNTPIPPKFQFQERKGKLNWRQIMSADAEKICNEVDLRQLESLLQNITYAKVDRDDIERFGDDNFIKLFRLSQMSIEYLIYTQNYLECLTKTLDLQYKNAYESTHDIQDQIKQQNSLIISLKKENQIKQKTLATYKYLMEAPKDGDLSKAMTCKQCSRTFASEHFLRKHYQRRHPDQDFDSEYPSKADFDKKTEAQQKQIIEQQKIEQEKLFSKMKQELIKSISGSIQQLENEISEIKQEQKKLEGIGKSSENDQKRLEKQLALSSDLLKEYKEQWNSQLTNHSQSVNSIVQQSIQEALKSRKLEQDTSYKEQLEQQKKIDQKNQEQIYESLQEYKKTFEKMSKEAEEKEQQLSSIKKSQKQLEIEKQGYKKEIEELKMQLDLQKNQLKQINKLQSNDNNEYIKEIQNKDKQILDMTKQLENIQKNATAKIDTNLAEARKLAAQDAEKQRERENSNKKKKIEEKEKAQVNQSIKQNLNQTKEVQKKEEKKEEAKIQKIEEKEEEQVYTEVDEEYDQEYSYDEIEEIQQPIVQNNIDNLQNNSGAKNNQKAISDIDQKFQQKDKEKYGKIQAIKNSKDELQVSSDVILKQQINDLNIDPSGQKISETFDGQKNIKLIDPKLDNLSKNELEKLNKNLKFQLDQQARDQSNLEYLQDIDDVLTDSNQSVPAYVPTKKDTKNK